MEDFINEIDNNLNEKELENIVKLNLRDITISNENEIENIKNTIKENINKIKKDNKLIKERKKYENTIIELKTKIMEDFKTFYEDKGELKTKIDNTEKLILNEKGDILKTLKQKFIEEYYENDLKDKLNQKKRDIISKFLNHKKYNGDRKQLEKDVEEIYNKLLKEKTPRSLIADRQSKTLLDAFNEFVNKK